MYIIGISRGAEYSPNMGEADSAVFEAVATTLAARGHSVTLFADADFSKAFPGCHRDFSPTIASLVERADGFFTMSRNPTTLNLLEDVEQCFHKPCVNTPRGIMACSVRSLLHEYMLSAGMPLPPTCFGSPADVCSMAISGQALLPDGQLRYPLWIKRNAGYSRVKEDVILARNDHEVLDVLADFARRNIEEVAFSEHVVGDLVKFYGVAATDFFDWDYAEPAHSKFGLEAVNGTAHCYAFDQQALWRHCDKFAEYIGVPVYGGDAVVRSDGSFVVIDFNDWPSFSRCLRQAAEAIVERVEKNGFAES